MRWKVTIKENDVLKLELLLLINYFLYNDMIKLFNIMDLNALLLLK